MKISNTHHQTRTGKIKKNPKKQIDYKYVTDTNLKRELQSIRDFLKVVIDEGFIKNISLKDNISFKHFNQYNPQYSKKRLINLFDEVESRYLEMGKLNIK